MSKHSFSTFWPSYADLMTNLFFIMLVLYVLTFAALRLQQAEIQVKAEQFDRIREIEESLKGLQGDSSNFAYEPAFKRYALKQNIHFAKGSDVVPQESYAFLSSAGQQLATIVNEAKVMQQVSNLNIKYLIIIEGMASKDAYWQNFELSYLRAKAIHHYWQGQKILFDPAICEIIISGSGIEGVGRDTIDESKNQRILIQVVPKIGNVNKTF